jgi:porphobilinogen deaminase
MPHAPRRLTIATRDSVLDLLQAESIRARLAALLHAGGVIGVLRVPMHDDRIGDAQPSSNGAREGFIKELELAMEEGRADLAIQALKDVPMELSPGFTLAAVVARDDPRDAFVFHALRTCCRSSGRRRRRHVEPAARGASARALPPSCRRVAAWQRRYVFARA